MQEAFSSIYSSGIVSSNADCTTFLLYREGRQMLGVKLARCSITSSSPVGMPLIDLVVDGLSMLLLLPRNAPALPSVQPMALSWMRRKRRRHYVISVSFTRSPGKKTEPRGAERTAQSVPW